MLKHIKRYERDFIKCGITGWCMEVLWTGINNMRNHDKKLSSNTSLLMFPIYGLASLIKPVYSLIKNKNFILRGVIYSILIYSGEFISGLILKKHDMCPWDYSKSKYNIKGIIRLDYAPAWFGAGLLFEKILKESKETQ